MPKLFCDLDGVAADFDTGYFNAFGIRPSKVDDNVDWEMVRARPNFYADLPPMDDFWELWDGIKHLNPTILTGCPPAVPEAEANKRAWVDKYPGMHVPMIACPSSEKSLHMEPGDIIIDDWPKYKDKWLKRGGIWITHTSAAQTLRDLQIILGGDVI